MIDVIPIAITVVDWPTFLASAKSALGCSISGTKDKYHLKDGIPAFMATLNELKIEEVQDPLQSLAEAGALLRHASASFFCVVTSFALEQLQEETDLAITSVEMRGGLKAVVVSGNLQQWRDAIINCSSARLVGTDARLLCNKFMAYFESAGLARIWANYSKTPMLDASYGLQSKWPNNLT